MRGVGVWRFEIEDEVIDLAEAWAGKGWEDLLEMAVRRWCVANKITQGRWVNVEKTVKIRSRRGAWKGKEVRMVRTSREDLTLVVAVHLLGDEFKEKGKGERDGVRVEGDRGRSGAGPGLDAGDGRRAGPAA